MLTFLDGDETAFFSPQRGRQAGRSLAAEGRPCAVSERDK